MPTVQPSCIIFLFQIYLVLVAVAVFILPALIIMGCYTMIIRIIWKNSHLLSPAVKHKFTTDMKKLITTNSSNGKYWILAFTLGTYNIAIYRLKEVIDCGLTSHQQLRSYGDGTSVYSLNPKDWRSPGSNLRPLVNKASGLTTAPRRLKRGSQRESWQ